MIYCNDCKGTNVQCAMWVNPNTHKVFDDFGEWNYQGSTWCDDCQEHTELIA